MNKGVLMVVSGPSGAGKGTVVRKLVGQSENVFLSVSATTRRPRPGEIHGKDYFFVSRDDFKAMIEKGELLEYAEYAGNYYGTPAVSVDRMLEEGKNVLLEIDMQGGRKIRRVRPDVVLVFLVPPSIADLESRLRGRGTETEAVIRKRLKIATREYRKIKTYDYIVINDTVDHAVAQLNTIFDAERCKVKRTALDEICRPAAQPEK